ncbi:MAG: hypothetical protein GY927_17765 [bacterium]|nr:hypothetical protein [bacterium]
MLVLRELERQLRFAEMIAGCMSDKRDPVSIGFCSCCAALHHGARAAERRLSKPSDAIF